MEATATVEGARKAREYLDDIKAMAPTTNRRDSDLFFSRLAYLEKFVAAAHLRFSAEDNTQFVTSK